MPEPPDESPWTCSHFSLSNPRGPDEGDLPLLMRRVADHVAALGDVTVLDVTLHSQTTPRGEWFAFTVYYAPANGDDDPAGDPAERWVRAPTRRSATPAGPPDTRPSARHR